MKSRKTQWQNFRKSLKSPDFWPFWVHFAYFGAKKNFVTKLFKDLAVFATTFLRCVWPFCGLKYRIKFLWMIIYRNIHRSDILMNRFPVSNESVWRLFYLFCFLDELEFSVKYTNLIDQWLKGCGRDISAKLMSISFSRCKFNVHFKNHG